MTFAFYSALLIYVPLVPTLRRRGLVTHFFCATILYGLYFLAVGILVILPAEVIREISAFIADFGFIHQSSITVEILFSAIAAGIAFPVFVVLTLVFWGLHRWGAPLFPKLSKPLFWLLHLSFTGPFVMITVSLLTLPPFFDGVKTVLSLENPQTMLICALAQATSILAFILLALLSAIMKLRH